MFTPQITIGMPALQLVNNLPSVHGIDIITGHALNSERVPQTYHFKVYSPSPALEKRLEALAPENESIKHILEEAVRLRALATTNLIPLWDSVFFAASVADRGGVFVRHAAKQNPNDDQGEMLAIKRDELISGRLGEKVATLPRNRAIAICSTCTLMDGSTLHIPMIDFRILPDPQSLTIIRDGLREIRQTSGVILESGNSYHFYGFKLLEREEWAEFLGNCLLLAPLTDARYIAHRLVEGMGALRITRSDLKEKIPCVVDIFDKPQ